MLLTHVLAYVSPFDVTSGIAGFVAGTLTGVGLYHLTERAQWLKPKNQHPKQRPTNP